MGASVSSSSALSPSSPSLHGPPGPIQEARVLGPNWRLSEFSQENGTKALTSTSSHVPMTADLRSVALAGFCVLRPKQAPILTVKAL